MQDHNPIAYLSGPDMTGVKYERAVAFLTGAGWIVARPTRHDIDLGDGDGSVSATGKSPEQKRKRAKADLDALTSLLPDEGDSLILMSGPHDRLSAAQRLEVSIARYVGMSIFVYAGPNSPLKGLADHE